jgi:hypothetical protein
VAFLQHAQELDLCRQREVQDLVQEQRPTRGEVKMAVLVAVGAREGASLVPEELGFDQRLGDCATIEGDEGPLAARAVLVNGACDQFLPGAGLALDQHGEVRGGNSVNLSDDLEDVRASAHLLTQAARDHSHPETVKFSSHGLLLDRPHDPQTQILVRKRLDHVVAGAEAHGVHGGGHVVAGGEHDDGSPFGQALAQAGKDLQAALPRQSDVEQDDRRGDRVDLLERSFSVFDGIDLQRVPSQELRVECAHLGSVIDHQDSRCRHGVHAARRVHHRAACAVPPFPSWQGSLRSCSEATA